MTLYTTKCAFVLQNSFTKVCLGPGNILGRPFSDEMAEGEGMEDFPQTTELTGGRTKPVSAFITMASSF